MDWGLHFRLLVPNWLLKRMTCDDNITYTKLTPSVQFSSVQFLSRV